MPKKKQTTVQIWNTKHEIQKVKKQKMDLEATIKALKGYLCNKTITSQNVSSGG